MSKTVAIVTGATSGIGKTTALILARKGIKVVASGRREALGRALVEEIRGEGGEAIFVAADVGEEGDVKRIVARAVEVYERLDMAVNNAGIAIEPRPFHQTDSNRVNEVMRTNVLGVYYSMKHEITQMLENGGGAIVNVASIGGIKGIPYIGPYVGTKHAVVGMTKVAALDYATQGIRVNAIAPGGIMTDIVADHFKDGHMDEASVLAMHPMARWGQPEEAANAIVWLLSHEASYITGNIMSIDGGWQAK